MRPVSRERTESTSSTSGTTPKYTGRSSISKDEIKYPARPSIAKSKEDLSLPKFKPVAKAVSREDLDTSPKKYITSRFLPKNAVEKSNTAYTRPTSTRLLSSQRETSRKNREILNLLSTHTDKTSRPSSRCSTTTSEDSSRNKLSSTRSTTTSSSQDMVTVTVISRSTSPTPPPQSKLGKTNKHDTGIGGKQITRPRKKDTVDKVIQCDLKQTKFPKAAATPWSSYLDLKFSSPGDSKASSHDNSKKSYSTTKSDEKSSPKSGEKLPPQSPAYSKISAPQSGMIFPNKDFRKSVLNMNPDGKGKLKTQRSSSVSSAESESSAFGISELPTSEAMDLSENLSSSKSLQKTSSSSLSKLPKPTTTSQTNVDQSHRSRRSCTRSPSEGRSSTAASSSEDDSNNRKSKLESKINKLNKTLSRTSIATSSVDDLTTDKKTKPPMSPRPKNEPSGRNEQEAKSFLMKALGPVTGLFKNKQDSSGENVSWLNNSNENVSENGFDPKYKLRHIDSGDASSWIDNDENSPGSETKKPVLKVMHLGEQVPGYGLLRHVASGENVRLLEDRAGKSSKESPKKTSPDNQRKLKSFHRVESGEMPWWLNSSSDVPEGVQIYSQEPSENDYLSRYHIRHIDSGEQPRWFGSAEDIPQEENRHPQSYKIHHQRSGEKAWWLGSGKSPKKSSDDESSSSESEDNVPLGDRASPEGLEMPKEVEKGRLSPYDNVPICKQKRPNALFISRHTNIDDILGSVSQSLSPLMNRIFGYHESEDASPEEFEKVTPDQVAIHDPREGVVPHIRP